MALNDRLDLPVCGICNSTYGCECESLDVELPHALDVEVFARRVIATQYAWEDERLAAAYRIIQRNSEARARAWHKRALLDARRKLDHSE